MARALDDDDRQGAVAQQERRPRERQEQVRVLVLRLEELGRARLDEPDAQVDGEDFAPEVLRRDRRARLVEGRPQPVDAHITCDPFERFSVYAASPAHELV